MSPPRPGRSAARADLADAARPVPRRGPTGSKRTTRSRCAWNRSTRRSRRFGRDNSPCSTATASARSRSRSAATPPRRMACLTQTIRDVGAVSRALHGPSPGDLIGARGPYGTDLGPRNRHRPRPGRSSPAAWDWRRCDLCCSTCSPGGLLFGRVVLIVGARNSGRIPVPRPARRLDGHTVDGDRAHGRRARRRLARSRRLCDRAPRPPTSRTAVDDRVPVWSGADDALLRQCAHRQGSPSPRASDVSLERNMKCGVGLCGHCQLGPLLVCRDGPVVSYDMAQPLLQPSGAMTDAADPRRVEVRLLRRMPADPPRLRRRAR